MSELLLLQRGVLLYIALFVALVGGGLGLPIPEDVPLIVAGIAVHNRVTSWQSVFAVCYGSILLGDLIVYAIGRRFGPGLFSRPWVRKRIPPARLKRVKLNLEKRSLLMIFLARHLFYLRTVTILACGAVKMHPRRFLLADAFAALFSVPLMLGLGYLFAEHYSTLLLALRQLNLALVAVLAVGVIVYFRRRKKRAAAKQQPTS